MKSTPYERSKLEQRLTGAEDDPGLTTSRDLFGYFGADIYDFEIYNYNYFLDNARSLDHLLDGLRQLSPFADDALALAEHMGDLDFCDFKLALAYERHHGDSKMPDRYLPLVIPKWFIPGVLLAEACLVPLGAALVRLIEFEENV